MSIEPLNPRAALEALPKLFQILEPLSLEDRERAITAVKIMLGHPTSSPLKIDPIKQQEEAEPPANGISSKATAWMKKHGVTHEQIDQVFSIDSDAIEVIATKMPGTSKRQQTVEAYVICGLKSLLQTGDPSFTDKEAREVCSKVGCYDTPNHSNYLKALGNSVAGSKETGWKLSNPGVSKAADIVKLLTQ